MCESVIYISKMVSVVKTMGVIGIITLFFVATTTAIPCCDGEYTSCCKSGDDVNVTTFAKVTGRKGAADKNTVPVVEIVN